MYRNSKTSGKIERILATLFGVGLIPWAPGTAGSAVAVPVAYGMTRFGLAGQTIFLVVAIVIAAWASDRAWRTAAEEDPGWIVIDEFVGLLLTFYSLHPSGLELVMGFALFRLLDIWKPGPIRAMERFRGAKGILMDDLLAGVIANLCLQGIHLLYPA